MEETIDTSEEITRLQNLLQGRQMELNSLLEVTQAINSNLPAISLFRIFEFILRAQMKVGKLCLYMENEKWECVSNFGLEKETHTINIQDLLKYRQVEKLEPTHTDLGDFEYLVPVFHKDKPLAYILIGNIKGDEDIDINDKIKFIQTITNIIVVAIENKKLFKRQIEQEGFKRELELAAKMQMLLIPETLPQNDKIEMAAVYLPHNEIGGDYYDYVPVNREEIIFCIADISGKGVAAALLMANFQANLRALLKPNLTPEKFIHNLNKQLYKLTKGEKFITLFIGKYNHVSKKLSYINAGHNPPLLLNNGKTVFLEEGCTILGMFDKLPFLQIGEIQCDSNNILICYTDGLTDLENEAGEFFQVEMLAQFVSQNSDLPMKKLNEKLLDNIIAFKEKKLFTDDITLLSCRFH